jgi:hypothetical protein
LIEIIVGQPNALVQPGDTDGGASDQVTAADEIRFRARALFRHVVSPNQMSRPS